MFNSIQALIQVLREPGKAVEKSLLQLIICLFAVFSVIFLAFLWVEQRLESHRSLNEALVVPVRSFARSVNEVMGSFRLRQNQLAVASSTHEAAALGVELKRDEKRLRGVQSEVEGVKAVLATHGRETRKAGEALFRSAGPMFEGFLAADHKFAHAVQNKLLLKEKLDQQIIRLEAELSTLLESASGISGKLRFRIGSKLRALKRKVNMSGWIPSVKTQVEEEIFASSGRQNRLVSDVSLLVGELNRLVGKVGLVKNIDQLRSLEANQLMPIGDRLSVTLETLRFELADDPKLASAVVQLESTYHRLTQAVLGDNENSLVSLQSAACEADAKAKHLQNALAELTEETTEFTQKLSQLATEKSRQFNASLQTAGTVAGWLLRFVLLVGAVGGVFCFSSTKDSLASLRKNNSELMQMRDNLTRLNQVLETKVAERTRALDESNGAMRMVLDNVQQGLATLDESGMVLPSRSERFNKWFQPPEQSVAFEALLGRHNQKVAAHFALAWEELQSGIMPMEINVTQLPEHLDIDGRNIEFQYSIISSEDNVPDRVLLIASDITEQLEHERSEVFEREFATVTRHLMRDAGGFREFLDESSQIVELICNGKETHKDVLFRAVHTLKGNCALFGLECIAGICHRVETEMAEQHRGPSQEEIHEIDIAWKKTIERLSVLMDHGEGDRLNVRQDDLLTLLSRKEAERIPQQVFEVLMSWRMEPVWSRLNRLSEQAKAMAKRLDKGDVEVRTTGGELRLPYDKLAPLWSTLTHVVRNAVDHGLEKKDVRVGAGKRVPGTIEIGLRQLDDGALEVSISDDGAGIDWAKVQSKAQELGVSCESEAELTSALFCNGLSTKGKKTGISGNGVGMSSVKAVIDSFGGTIKVESTPGEGTCFTFLVPSSLTNQTLDLDGTLLAPHATSLDT